ncbi:hypothetical protein PFISCL1PPCAC_3900, partial [Pristionchus fissidentatus]
GSIKMASPSVLSLCKKTSHSQSTSIPGCDATRSIDAAATHAAAAAKKRQEDTQVVIDLSSNDESTDEFAFLHSKNQSKSTTRNGKKRAANFDCSESVDEEEAEEGEWKKRKKQKMTNIECPICSLNSISVRGAIRHLQKIHETTPKEQDMIYRCSCGFETASRYHEDHGK